MVEIYISVLTLWGDIHISTSRNTDSVQTYILVLFIAQVSLSRQTSRSTHSVDI